MIKKLTALIISLFILGVGTVYAVNYPDYHNYVNDYADILKPEEESKLNEKLRVFDEQTTNQIAIAIIKSLAGENLESYSIKLAEKWKPGTEEKDNGILMLFAMDDRKMRNEVGQGLEGDLTDTESRHIQDDIIKPRFKEGKYYEGLDEGTTAIMQAIATDSAIATASTTATDVSAGTLFAIIVIILIVGAIVLFIIAESPYTPIGGQGTWGITDTFASVAGASFFSDGSDGDDGGGFGGFGGGGFSGGGSSSSW